MKFKSLIIVIFYLFLGPCLATAAERSSVSFQTDVTFILNSLLFLVYRY